MALSNLHSPKFGAAASSTNDYSNRIGQKAQDAKGNRFQFVEFDNASSVSAVPGSPLGWTTTDEGSTVTCDLSRSTSLQVMGIAMCSLGPTNKFGWALIEAEDITEVENTSAGSALTIKTDGNVAAATKLVFVADKVCDGRADDPDSLERSTYIGYAYEADSGSQLVKARVGLIF